MNGALSVYDSRHDRPPQLQEHCYLRMQADEPEFTRHKVRAFLQGHTCYELIPESGKVVVLDVGLPIRQAFHALHEQARAVQRLPLMQSHCVERVASQVLCAVDNVAP